MADKSMITTAVDDLIHLVKDSGKISLMEAAKKLDVPQKTVETWVDFLVEEERLSIEYKFTTPYIFLNKDFADEEDELSISKEDFELEIKREEITVDEGEGRFHEYVTKIINQFKNIQFLITQKKLDQAYEQYNLLSVDINDLPKSELSNIFNRNLIKLNYGLLLLYKEFIAKSKETAEQMAVLEKTGSVYVVKEEIEQAKKTYSEMKKMYDTIPLMMVPQREGLYDAMYFFFKKIVNAERIMVERIHKESEVKISHVKSEIKRFLHEDKIHDAEQHLVSLKEIYYSLPAELVSYKLLLYNDILRMYEEVSIANRFEVLKSELDQLGSEIKLPPLSDLLYSPLASAINTSEDEIKKISEQEMSASSSEIGLEDNKTKPAETKEDDYLSVLPKVGVNTSDSQEHKNNDSSELKSKPEESSKKTLPLISEQPVQNKVDPSSVQEKDEGTSNSVVTNTTAKNSNNDTSTSTNSFDGVSSDAFSSLLSKENPMMKEAAEAYNEKDYEKAKRLFESILTTDPYNSKAKQMLSLTNGILSSSNQNLQHNEQDKTGVVPVR